MLVRRPDVRGNNGSINRQDPRSPTLRGERLSLRCRSWEARLNSKEEGEDISMGADGMVNGAFAGDRPFIALPSHRSQSIQRTEVNGTGTLEPQRVSWNTYTS
jgi:hypothetical protein